MRSSFEIGGHLVPIVVSEVNPSCSSHLCTLILVMVMLPKLSLFLRLLVQCVAVLFLFSAATLTPSVAEGLSAVSLRSQAAVHLFRSYICTTHICTRVLSPLVTHQLS